MVTVENSWHPLNQSKPKRQHYSHLYIYFPPTYRSSLHSLPHSLPHLLLLLLFSFCSLSLKSKHLPRSSKKKKNISRTHTHLCFSQNKDLMMEQQQHQRLPRPRFSRTPAIEVDDGNMILTSSSRYWNNPFENVIVYHEIYLPPPPGPYYYYAAHHYIAHHNSFIINRFMQRNTWRQDHYALDENYIINDEISVSGAVNYNRSSETTQQRRSSSLSFERIKIEECSEEESTITCSICLSDLSNGSSEAVRLPHPCSHIFHHDCIIKWFHISNTCPLCRRTTFD